MSFGKLCDKDKALSISMYLSDIGLYVLFAKNMMSEKYCINGNSSNLLNMLYGFRQDVLTCKNILCSHYWRFIKCIAFNFHRAFRQPDISCGNAVYNLKTEI